MLASAQDPARHVWSVQSGDSRIFRDGHPFAGVAGATDPVDGRLPEARFNQPSELAVDSQFTVHILEADRVRTLSPAGEVATVLQNLKDAKCLTLAPETGTGRQAWKFALATKTKKRPNLWSLVVSTRQQNTYRVVATEPNLIAVAADANGHLHGLTHDRSGFQITMFMPTQRGPWQKAAGESFQLLGLDGQEAMIRTLTVKDDGSYQLSDATGCQWLVDDQGPRRVEVSAPEPESPARHSAVDADLDERKFPDPQGQPGSEHLAGAWIVASTSARPITRVPKLLQPGLNPAPGGTDLEILARRYKIQTFLLETKAELLAATWDGNAYLFTSYPKPKASHRTSAQVGSSASVLASSLQLALQAANHPSGSHGLAQESRLLGGPSDWVVGPGPDGDQPPLPAALRNLLSAPGRPESPYRAQQAWNGNPRAVLVESAEGVHLAVRIHGEVLMIHRNRSAVGPQLSVLRSSAGHVAPADLLRQGLLQSLAEAERQPQGGEGRLPYVDLPALQEPEEDLGLPLGPDPLPRHRPAPGQPDPDHEPAHPRGGLLAYLRWLWGYFFSCRA